MQTSARAVAATAIEEVVYHGRSLSSCIAPLLGTLPDRRDRALAQECTYGVLRWFQRLDHQLQWLLRRPLRQRDADVHMLLLVGLYQIQYLHIAAHAAVSATVDACQALGKPWAKSLLNAVLRKALRERDRLEGQANQDEPARWAHPQWLIDEIRAAWPAQWEDVLTENNRRAPLCLRVNPRKIARDAYLDLLQQTGLEALPTGHAETGVRLLEPVPVDDLPGFADGYASVQDEAAQLAARLLDVRDHARVLDACAAPGGKTAHILEICPPDVTVTALDSDRARLDDLEANLRRLDLECRTICSPAADTERWWDGSRYDRILLDAPCSATGVIRRHPDIKFLRRQADLEQLEHRQTALLDTVWPLLRGGGMLLYATCTILRRENDDVIDAFLSRADGADIRPIEAAWGRPGRYGRQILPGVEQMDGFYYACIIKRTGT